MLIRKWAQVLLTVTLQKSEIFPQVLKIKSIFADDLEQITDTLSLPKQSPQCHRNPPDHINLQDEPFCPANPSSVRGAGEELAHAPTSGLSTEASACLSSPTDFIQSQV